MLALVVHTSRLGEVRDILRSFGIADKPKVYEHNGKDILNISAETAEILKLCELVYIGVRSKTARAWRTRYGLTPKHSVDDAQGLASILGMALPRPSRLPSEEFRIAAQTSGLVLASDALLHADRITPRRYDFAIRSARALAEYARCTGAPRGLAQFFRERDLNYAGSGSTEALYDVTRAGVVVARNLVTEWHLKEGDRTTQEDAARIYFHSTKIEGTWHLFVLRCGPHPGRFRTVCALP